MDKPRRMDGYVRVSRRMGREGPAYISPDVQREAVQRWADFRGVEIVRWHVDEDESGGTQDRPGLRAAIARVEAGQTDGVACWRLNRFARNVAAAIEDVRRVQAAGGSLAFVDEDIDPTGPFGSFVLTVLLAVATLERDNVVEGWKVAKARAVERGAPIGPTPWGYSRQSDGTLAPDPDASPIVAQAYKRAADRGHHSAMEYLREHAPERTWTTTTLRRLLASRAYLGEVRYADMVKRAAHVPLVDRATWERAQVPTDAPRARAADYPLSGLARCAACGEPLVGGRGGRNRRMYRCRAGVTTWPGERCDAPPVVTAEHLEAFVLDRIVAAYREADRGAVVVSGGSGAAGLAEAEGELEAAERELERFAADPVAAESLGEAAWRAAVASRGDRVRKAREALRITAEGVREPVRLPVLDALADLGPSELRDVYRAAVATLTVAKGRGALADRVVLRLDGDV